jgi:hypothetical protein
MTGHIITMGNLEIKNQINGRPSGIWVVYIHKTGSAIISRVICADPNIWDK